ncbi:MAG: deoxyribose-phosphate aldolase [Hyphomicrobiales bacterium]
MTSSWNRSRVAACIDHTLLKPVATDEQIVRLCREALESNFAAVCVNPCYIRLAVGQLAHSPVKACSVIGFPLGASTTRIKAAEAELAVAEGATEVDMVISVGALKSGRLVYVEDDIRQVVTAAGEALVKVIIETCFLTDTEKVTACRLAMNAGAGFVKTSTGFGSGGATVADVRLMRSTVGSALGVKASGGVRALADALAMLEAGASRIGTSSGVEILSQIPD